ncbi:MAG: hypothetical protein JNJ57_10090 [Saprospiraceae bacterium]|nr:hypothetical protein [Saprospiraceae bacterium]
MKPGIFLIIALAFIACKKDPPKSEMPDEVDVFRTHQPCDTVTGRADAVIDTLMWSGGGFLRSFFIGADKFWYLQFYTCDKFGNQRGFLTFKGIPDSNRFQTFKIKENGPIDSLKAGDLYSSFMTICPDGSPETLYIVDETIVESFFTIDQWDEQSKRVEGRFSASFKITPFFKFNGPYKLLFKSGRFWAKIPD